MKIILIAVALIVAAPAFAQVHVNGYMKQNGTYVQPHERTAPNNTNLDNYSTKGNVNPYTGQAGTKDPEPYGYQNAQPAQRAQQPRDTLNQLQPPSIQPLSPMQAYKPQKF